MLALLDERRTNVTTQRTRLVNQLHAVFRDLSPGGAPKGLTATTRLWAAGRHPASWAGRGGPQAARP